MLTLSSSSLLLVAFFVVMFHDVVAAAATRGSRSRLDLLERRIESIEHLERRIESLEQLVESQSTTIEDLLRIQQQEQQRHLQTTAVNDDVYSGCLPKLNKDTNVCVYDNDVEFLFQNSSLVFNSSTVRFTGPLLKMNATDTNETWSPLTVDAGNNNSTNQTYLQFSSRVIFDSTDIIVNNANVSFAAGHNYSSLEYPYNETNNTRYYGYITLNNTDVGWNNSSVVFSSSNITIDNSNTTFTTNSSSGTYDSSIVFNHTKIRYNHTEVVIQGSTTTSSDSSVSYGKNTNVEWIGTSSSANFIDTDVKFDNTIVEVSGDGDRGKFISEVETEIRGSKTLTIRTNVNFKGDSDVTIDHGVSLTTDGPFRSNDKAEFRSDMDMVDVTMTIQGDLIIDNEGKNDDAHSDIEFRKGVNVKIYSELEINGDLKVSGHTDVDSLDVDNHATIGGRFTCRSGATITGDKLSSSSDSSSSWPPLLLKVEGNTLIQNDLEVEGILTSAAQEFNGDIVVMGNAKVYSLEVESTAKIDGIATVGTIKADTGIIDEQLTAGSIIVESDIFFENIEVSGEATIHSASFQNINVSETAVIKALNATTGSVSKLINVTGNISVSENLQVGGSLSATSASISGEADIQVLNAGYSEFEDITVLGTATVLGDLNVDSNLDVLGDIKLGGTITNITE